MGEPWFKIRHLQDSHGLVALSANFTLYGDMSDRMMSLAAGLGPTQEVYSIDESFIGMHGVRGDLVRRSHIIRARILRWVGIPCGIGLGSTKTLAKLANHVAKTAERKPGSYPEALAQVCNLSALPPNELDAVLAATDVGDVWGVGRRIGAQLQADGVHTALALAQMDPSIARARWGVVMERTVRELQGTPCIALEDAPAPKQQIACTRSFGRPVSELAPLIEAVSEFAARAAEKLRKQGSLAGQLQVFVHTSPFRPGPRYARGAMIPLRTPTSDTRHLVQAAVAGVRKIYRPGFDLVKAGVLLLDITAACANSSAPLQSELDLEDDQERDRSRLMSTMDELNRRFGRSTVHVASTGAAGSAGTAGTAGTFHASGTVEPAWSMRQERRTPHYTTNWDEVPIARA